MSASSLSIAAAAIGTCSNCFLNSPSSTDHQHPSVYSFPYKVRPLKPPQKIKILFNSSPYSPMSLSSIFCASTALDIVDLNEEETVSGVEEKENDVSRSVDDGRLYVGDLPFTMTPAHLSEMFAKAGRVVSVELYLICDRVTERSRGFAFVTMRTVEEAKEAIRLFHGAIWCRLSPYAHADTGGDAHFGSTGDGLKQVFASPFLINRSVIMINFQKIGGRTIKVNFPEVPRAGKREVMSPKIRSNYQDFVDSPYKIYAGNLSWGLTSHGLREAFADQPGVISAKVIYDRDSGRSRGFGFITFSSAGEAESALNTMNGVGVEGRPLRLNLWEQRDAASPPPSVENKSENTLETSGMFDST
ncbi:hypothetical protein OROGR_023963 [Orobanche gracilis]